MADDQQQSDKTEKATAKRLADAARKGDFAKSQDVATFFVFMGGLAVLVTGVPLFSGLWQTMTAFIATAHHIPVNQTTAHSVLTASLIATTGPLAAAGVILLVFALIGHLVQHPPAWTASKIIPKLDKISPIKGMARLFGAQGWMNLLRAALKLIAMTGAIGYALWPGRSQIDVLGLIDLQSLIEFISSSAVRMMIAGLVSVGLIAAIDYAWQRHSFMKRMMMSRRDIRDEMRQSEGDPMIRSRLRAIRQERGRKRMMAAVADATVVVTNPTHYAVALAYDATTGDPPVCVAKGVDHTALRIRHIARDKKIPVVENPPLARTLHAGVELDQPIPVENYEAVAKIIGYVMQTSKARR